MLVTIKEKVLPNSLSFDLPSASKEDINKIVKSLTANKATESDGIPHKLIKNSASVLEKYITSIINHDISQCPIYCAPYNTNHFVKLCFSSQKILLCKPCTNNTTV